MKKETQRKKRRSYDAAFKANLLKMNADGGSVSSLSESFGVSENLIYRWKSKVVSPSDRTITEESKEIIGLRMENRRLKEERDILKKALSIFSRHP